MATDLKTAKPLENTVEADETFCKNFTGDARRAIDALIVERNGESRMQVTRSVTAHNRLDPFGSRYTKIHPANTR